MPVLIDYNSKRYSLTTFALQVSIWSWHWKELNMPELLSFGLYGRPSNPSPTEMGMILKRDILQEWHYIYKNAPFHASNLSHTCTHPLATHTLNLLDPHNTLSISSQPISLASIRLLRVETMVTMLAYIHGPLPTSMLAWMTKVRTSHVPIS